MDRRGFLGTLLASVGALAIDPSTLLWRPPAVAEALPMLEPAALVNLNLITLRMAQEIQKQWQGGRVVSSGLIGQEGLRHQFNVAMGLPREVDRYGLDVDRYLKPAADAMVARLQQAKISRCGTLVLPEGPYQSSRVTAKDTGLSVRGTIAYQVPQDGHVLRFDVVCG